MGESVPSMIGGPLIIIVILTILFWRGHRRTSRLKDLTDCTARFRTTDHNVKVAASLLTQAGQVTWVELCRQLTQLGDNPALQPLQDVADETLAENLFMDTKAVLEKLLAEARIQLEVAVSYFPTEEA
jgi:hypothetical protein